MPSSADDDDDDEWRRKIAADFVYLKRQQSDAEGLTLRCPNCCHVDTAIKHPVPDRVKLSFVIFNIRHDPGTLTLSPERQSARISKITNGGLTRSGTGCFTAVPTWQHWASTG